MKTKALLGLAVLAAGALTATAQNNVYSLNVVGYYNLTIPANQRVLIANQLNTANNTIGSLLPNGPVSAQLFKYNGSYTAYNFDDIANAWLPDGNATLNPGEGCFFISPTATTLTFVGEVMQGSLTNSTPINQLVLRSSMVPQAGKITADLGLPGEAGDQMYTYNKGYTAYNFDDIAADWLPNQPTLNVGDAFFLRKAATSTSSLWVRNFTVQ